MKEREKERDEKGTGTKLYNCWTKKKRKTTLNLTFKRFAFIAASPEMEIIIKSIMKKPHCKL